MSMPVMILLGEWLACLVNWTRLDRSRIVQLTFQILISSGMNLVGLWEVSISSPPAPFLLPAASQFSLLGSAFGEEKKQCCTVTYLGKLSIRQPFASRARVAFSQSDP
jgi:hypothetical protein